MGAMLPVLLGAIIFGSYAVSLVIRQPLEKLLILQAPASRQARGQFILDFSLAALAGVLAGGFNVLVLDAWFVSGARLFFGMFAAGFFIGVDMSLARERRIIRQSAFETAMPAQLGHYTPMSLTFSAAAIMTAIFCAVVLLLVLARDLAYFQQVGLTSEGMALANRTVTVDVLFILGVILVVVIHLILSYSRNLKLSFKIQIDALKRVSNGDLEHFIPPTTRNEFGFIAGYTNEMILALKHRIALMTALKLAEEVQRNLLPEGPPETPGIRIAARIVYSEGTGGDYYDFIQLPDQRLAAIVGDVSGHGVASALLMASARAFLRMASDHHTDLAEIVRRVNMRLTMDVDQSGNFFTLFLVEVDPVNRRLLWVRAGHDPALLYDPARDDFIELGGNGRALGLDSRSVFEVNERQGWTGGSILLIGTDGIWETHDARKQMYGKARLKALVRARAADAPDVLLEAVLEDLRRFRDSEEPEDDVTLVIVKLA